jgi:hypothetical protein
MRVQGSGDARYALSRLAPLQRDTAAEQDAQLPVLAGLAPGERAALLTAQAPTEEPSMLAWCRGLGVEVPASPDALTAALAHMAVA